MSLIEDMMVLESLEDGIPEVATGVNSSGQVIYPGGEDPSNDPIAPAEERFIASMLLREFASPAELAELAEDAQDMADISDDMGIAMERTIVRLDRNARKRHLRKANTLALARKANHPKWRKLMTIWKMERQLEGELDRIYGNKASQLANVQIRNYAANGIKKIGKQYPSTTVGKGRVAGSVAQRAVSNANKFFSPGNRTGVHKDDVAGRRR